MNGLADSFEFTIEGAFSHSGMLAWSEAQSPSLLLIRVPQGRDVVTALQLLHDFDMHVLDEGIH
jgi:hypothetical protein